MLVAYELAITSEGAIKTTQIGSATPTTLTPDAYFVYLRQLSDRIDEEMNYITRCRKAVVKPGIYEDSSDLDWNW